MNFANWNRINKLNLLIPLIITAHKIMDLNSFCRLNKRKENITRNNNSLSKRRKIIIITILIIIRIIVFRVLRIRGGCWLGRWGFWCSRLWILLRRRCLCFFIVSRILGRVGKGNCRTVSSNCKNRNSSSKNSRWMMGSFLRIIRNSRGWINLLRRIRFRKVI